MTPDVRPTEDRIRGPRSATSRRRAASLGAAALLLAVLGAGCSKDTPTDPAEARLQRVEARLRSSFSARQARCILEQLDTPVVRALDQRADLTADSPALKQFSAALQVCVNGDGATTTTRSAGTAPASTTTGPGG
ncbi:MAG: hypothetical protein JWM89_3519 [Acidimicrobiales bacterium]|nr:hypothetical protein [Acidimicrobiales bacterium]